MSHAKWTELDLYHGVVGKLKQMVVDGKFNRYAYKYQPQTFRGTNAYEMVNNDLVMKDINFEIKQMSFSFTFRSRLLHPNDTTEGNHSDDMEVDLEVQHKMNTVINLSGSSSGAPTLNIFFSSKHGNFFFQWKDLQTKHVDLDTVLHHYFEHCFLEVPLFHLQPLEFDPHRCDEKKGNRVLLKAVNENKKENYEEIVQYYESSLSFAMSQHKRLGQACQYWDMPDTCLALIHLLHRPQFGKLP
jgi:hypothetical protein